MNPSLPRRAASQVKERFNPFASGFHNQKWIVPVTAMSLVLGFMISTAWVSETNRTGRFSLLGPDQRQRVSGAAIDLEEFKSLQSEVEKLRKDKTKLENTVATGGAGEKTLNDALQEAKVFASLTPVEGPGIIVTLRDKVAQPATGGSDVITDDIIHDGDVLRVVNELLASAPEAVSVNGLRHTGATSYRCVGPTILVDGARIASPVVIRAIGDAPTLLGGMNLPGGVLSEIRDNAPQMVQLEAAKKLSLPAYSGSTARKLVTVPKDPTVKTKP